MTKKGQEITKLQPEQMKLPMLDLSFLQLYSSEIRDNKLIQRLNPYTFSIWVLLRANCKTSGADSGKIMISMRDIREATGFGINTVKSCIDSLVEKGLLKVVTEGTSKRRYYVIDIFKDTTTKEEIVKVEYKPNLQSVVRNSLNNWQTGKGSFPEMPGVTLIQQNAQTIVNIYVKDAEQAVKIGEKVARKLSSGDGRPWEKYLVESGDDVVTTINVTAPDET